MTALEERLRRAVDVAVDVPSTELYVDGVRRGARRRRMRRALAGSVAAALAVAAGIAVVSRLGNATPEPVRPGPVVEQDGAPYVGGPVVLLTQSGVGDESRLYGLSVHGSASCFGTCAHTLWLLEDGRREALFRFPADRALADVVMAPDGQNGLAVSYGPPSLLRTADGGESWFEAGGSFIDRHASLEVEVLGEHVYAYVGGRMSAVRSGEDGTSPKQYRLWRSPLDGDVWAEVPLPFAPGFDLATVPDRSGSPALLALESVRAGTSQAGRAVGQYWTSADGTTWAPAGPPAPCDRPRGESWLRHGLLWVWCGDDTALQLHRSVGLGPFEAWGPTFTGHLGEHVLGPLLLTGDGPEDAVAFVTERGRVYRLPVNGPAELVDGPAGLLGWADSHAAGLSVSHRGTTYVRDPAGVLHLTRDGGLTWSPGP